MEGGNDVLRSVVRLPDNRLVAAYSVHIAPPFDPAGYSRGVSSTQDLAAIIAQETLPVIVGGDFNATVYSPKIHSFAESVATNDVFISDASVWPPSSWFSPGVPGLQMRIDHIFVGARVVHAGETVVGPDTGSDHRVLSTSLMLEAKIE